MTFLQLVRVTAAECDAPRCPERIELDEPRTVRTGQDELIRLMDDYGWSTWVGRGDPRHYCPDDGPSDNTKLRKVGTEPAMFVKDSGTGADLPEDGPLEHVPDDPPSLASIKAAGRAAKAALGAK